MADRLVIQIDGNSSGLQKALQSAETRLNTFNTRVTNSSRNLTNFINRMKSVNAGLTGFNASIQSVTAANARLAASLNATATRMNQFGNNARRAGASARSASAGMGSMNIGVRDLIMGMTSLNTLIYTSAFLFGGVTKSVIDANSRMEKMTVMLKNISGFGDEATKSLYAKKGNDFLWDLAANAPFKIDVLSKAFVKLKANGIDPMGGSLKTITDAIATFGGGSEELERASTAISQMLSKGTVQLEDLKGQLAETGGVPSAIKDMAVAAGFDNSTKGMQKFFAAMKKGSVDSATTIPKLMEVWEAKFGGNAAKMMNTWEGLMARLSTSWQRMIVRVTEDQGSNSLFATIKAQVLELTNFLASANGDQFMKDLTSGLATVAVAIVDGIKWLYKYREELGFVAKAMAYAWVGGRIIAAITAMRNGLNGLIGTVIATRAALITMAATGNGTSLVTSVMGANFARAAAKLGILNAAGAISIVGFGMVAAVFLGIATAVLAAYAAFNYYSKAIQANGTATKASTQALAASNVALEKQRKEVVNVTYATEAQRKATIEKMKAEAAAAKQTVIAARANVLLARSAYLAADAEAKRKFDKNYDEQTTGFDEGGGLAAGAGSLLGTKAERDKAKGLRDTLENRYKTYKNELANFESKLGNLQLAVAAPVINADAATGSGKKDKPKPDPLGDLDGSRSALVSKLMANKKLEAQLLDDGKTEEEGGNMAIQKFDDNAEAIEENIRKQVMAIKSQKELNAQLATAKAATYGLTTAVRTHTKDLAQHAKIEGMIENLTATRLDQDAQAQDALGGLDASYNGITNAVDRYVEKLKEKNREALGSDDLLQQEKARNNILAAGESKRAELLANAAGEASRNAQDIYDSLSQEDQMRQSVFDREMARVYALIEANKQLNDPNATLINENLRKYQTALELKNRIDGNPFAKWAIGIKDMQTGINDVLVGSMDGFIDTLMNGKAAFGDFAKSLIADLAKVIIKAYLANAILSALGLGSGAITGASTARLNGAAQSTIAANPGIFHTGGMVGGTPPATRPVDPSIFAFAQKYHTGGMVGLGPDEVPIIAQKGEGVFTAEQMKAMGTSMGSKGEQSAPQINIINQTGTNVEKEQSQPRFDGEQMVVDIILKHGSKPGPVRNMLMGQQG
jgi:tape measure domain-containing protein